MNKSIISGLFSLMLTVPLCSLYGEDEKKAEAILLPPVLVVGEASRLEADVLAPVATSTKLDSERFNVVNPEDTLKYMPGINVRKRYIGDSNGVLQIRGNHSWQNGRSMVFADGLPIHYHLRSRWNGAPRWNIVSPSEVEATEVVYGPFQAEYGGGAMGGVVNFKTSFPESQEVHFSADVFSQDFSYYGVDDQFWGHKQQLSYGDRRGNFKYFLMFDHLNNESQPQSFRGVTKLNALGSEPDVGGVFRDQDPRGKDRILYGDSGVDEVESTLLKFKTAYDFNRDWTLSATAARIAFDKDSLNATNYIKDSTGQHIWGDKDNDTNDASFSGEAFSINNKDFGLSRDRREEYLFGLGLDGELGQGWTQRTTLSWYHIDKNQNLSSELNPNDPLYDGSGDITDLDGSKWQNIDIKLTKSSFAGVEGLNFHTGFHWDDYSYRSKKYKSDDWDSGRRESLNREDGGDTSTRAFFAQGDWRFSDPFVLSLGLRQERWEMTKAFKAKSGEDPVLSPDRHYSEWSPKFSLLYEKSPSWNIRYSAAVAHRFPLSEELFGNFDNTRTLVVADANLNPEKGIHHSLSHHFYFEPSVLRFTLFYDDIKNTIFAQRDTLLLDKNTFLNIDEVTTKGVELAYDHSAFVYKHLDFQINASYQSSVIEKNTLNPSSEGNRFPRSPRWRVNALMSLEHTPQFSSSLGFRYSSNQYGRLQNDDHGSGYGAVDSFFITDLKFNYRLGGGFSLSAGVDNLFDREIFVHHPYPQRTFFLGGKWQG